MEFKKYKYMKKLILSMILLMAGASSYAQNSIYIIFTPITNKTKTGGIEHIVSHVTDSNIYRYAPHYFTIQNTSLKAYKIFTDTNKCNQRDNPIVTKPVSFLKSVTVLNWDDFGAKLTAADADSMVRYIDSHDKIYFIDRNEIKNGIMQVIPVKLLKTGDDIIIAD